MGSFISYLTYTPEYDSEEFFDDNDNFHTVCRKAEVYLRETEPEVNNTVLEIAANNGNIETLIWAMKC